MVKRIKTAQTENGPIYVLEKRDVLTTVYVVCDTTFGAVRALYSPLIVAGATYGVNDCSILAEYLPDGARPRYTRSERSLLQVLSDLKVNLLAHGGTPEAVRLMINLGQLDEKEQEMAKAKLASKGAAPAAAPAKGKGNPDALKKAREAKAEAGPDTRKITILNKENPYRADSGRATSFDALKGAKTAEDYKSAGGKVKYLSRWVEEGRIKLG